MTTPPVYGGTPLAHYLPYWHLDDDVLVNVDGSMAVAWSVNGVDISCTDNQDVNTKADALRRALNLLPSGYNLQLLRRARTLDDAFFDQYLSVHRANEPLFKEQRAMSAESLKRLGLRRFETYAVLTHPRALGAFGAPGTDAPSRWYNKLFRKTDPLALTVAQHDAGKRELLATAQNLQQAITSTGAGFKRLDGQGLLALIFTFLNPSASAASVPALADALPRDLPAELPVYRDLTLREQVLRTDVVPDLDTISLDDPLRPHRILAMKDLPRVTLAGLIRGAQRIAHDHWLVVGVTALDSGDRESKIERRRNKAFADARGKFTRNAKADAEFQELEQVLDQMAKRDQRLFELDVHVLIGADNLVELDDRTRATIETARTDMRVVLQTATYSQFHAWLGMMPGAGHRSEHRRTVLTDNAADFIPIFTSSPGAAKPLFVLPYRSGEPFLLDVANPKKANWNINVFGSSGKGKSYFTNGLIATSMLGQGSPVIVIDVGGRDEHGNIVGSYYRQCQLAGGEYFEFGLDGKNAVNIFMPRAELYASDKGEPLTNPNATKLNFLTGVVEMLLRDEGTPALTTVQVALIQKAIVGAYTRWAEHRTPLLEDLVPEFNALGGDRDDTFSAKAFAKTLQAWISGPYGSLLNTPGRIRPKTNFTVFDMKGLEGLGRLAPVVMMILTSYVWSMIARPRNGLAWVIYDECWALLKDPTAARLQEELYRTARKLNCGVLSCTQRIEDFLSSPGAQAVLANAESTFLLAHDAKVRPKVTEICGLNDREAALFASLEMRKGYFSEVFFKPSEGSVDAPALLRYYATPLDYWLNTTDPRDRELERDVLARYNNDRATALRRLATDYPNGAIAGGYTPKEAA